MSDLRWTIQEGAGDVWALRKDGRYWLDSFEQRGIRSDEVLAILNAHDALVSACRSASYALDGDEDEVAQVEAHRDIVSALRLAGADVL